MYYFMVLAELQSVVEEAGKVEEITIYETYLGVHDFPAVLLHVVPLNEIKKVPRIPSISSDIADEAVAG